MLNADDVVAAADRIAGYVRRTPTIAVEAGELADVPLVLKLELLQRSGSFKARGAFHFLLTQGALATPTSGTHRELAPSAPRPSRVVTASGGVAVSLRWEVSDGVEDQATARALADVGCDTGQGLYFGAAMAPQAFLDLLGATRP